MEKIVKGRTRNLLRRERDYIANPKESGYRSLHLIYKYNGQKEAYKGQFVELQIRSKIQHAWATAVEVIGAFTGQALKASQGDKEWINFFRLTSLAFTELENKQAKKVTSDRKQLKLIVDKLEVFTKLSVAFAVSIDYVKKKIPRWKLLCNSLRHK